MTELRRTSDGRILGPSTPRAESYDEQQLRSGGRPVAPYYDQDGITIYRADCGDVLAQLGTFDLLLTDPPYGIGADAGQRGRANRRDGHAWAASADYGVTNWDHVPVDPALLERARGAATHQIIFGGNYFALPTARCWLVWDKQNGANDYADCELAWTNLDKPVRRLVYRWHGMLQEPGLRKETRIHPTQKPEAVMRWALLQAPASATVLDPFMGSGTTLVAAKRLGRRAVGIEREQSYCDLAVERLQQGVLPIFSERESATDDAPGLDSLPLLR